MVAYLSHRSASQKTYGKYLAKQKGTYVTGKSFTEERHDEEHGWKLDVQMPKILTIALFSKIREI